MKQNIAKTALLTLSLCILGSAQAETRYVSDQLKINMRSGESTSHKIIRMISSGTGLEVISSNPDTGYSHITTPGGQTGYVLTRQLMELPSARERLATAEARVEELEQEPGRLSSQLADLQEEHQQLSANFDLEKNARAEAEHELENIRRTAADAIRMSKERTSLQKAVQDLTREVEDLKQENLDLRNESMQRWFMVGSGVTVLGIILGLILPRLRIQRRRDSWDTL